MYPMVVATIIPELSVKSYEMNGLVSALCRGLNKGPDLMRNDEMNQAGPNREALVPGCRSHSGFRR